MKGLTFGVLAAVALLSMETQASNLPQGSYYAVEPSVMASEGLLDDNVSLKSYYSYYNNYGYYDYYYGGNSVSRSLDFLWSILVLVCCCPVVIWYKCCYKPTEIIVADDNYVNASSTVDSTTVYGVTPQP